MLETQLQTMHNITDFKVVYICPDHNEKYHTRKLHMDDLLQSMGFKDIVHFKSGNERYPICLAKATKEIMLRYLDEPFLLVEDDIGITNHLEFTIPLDADAIYLGLSLCATHPTENRNVYYSEFEKYTADQVKVINMLATHAILYVSRKYKEAVIKAMDISIEQNIAPDVCITRIQKEYTIYANKIPTFYQSNKFNSADTFNVERATKIQIMEDLSLQKYDQANLSYPVV